MIVSNYYARIIDENQFAVKAGLVWDKARAQLLLEQKIVLKPYPVSKVATILLLSAAFSQLTFLILNLADAFLCGL